MRLLKLYPTVRALRSTVTSIAVASLMTDANDPNMLASVLTGTAVAESTSTFLPLIYNNASRTTGHLLACMYAPRTYSTVVSHFYAPVQRQLSDECFFLFLVLCAQLITFAR